MITKWKVSNFKSIREETELDLGPLTIFAGANSSGKSTFIQSILLVAQTLAHKIGSRSVVLNGALTSLGQFDDLKSNGGESDQITIKCTCRPISDEDTSIRMRPRFTSRRVRYYRPGFTQLKEVGCEISFDADPSSSQRDLYQIQPRLFSTQLSCLTRDEDNVDQKTEISIRHSTKTISGIEEGDSVTEIGDHLRAWLDYAVELDDDSMAEAREDYRSAKPIGCMLLHFLPKKIVYEINAVEEVANTITTFLKDGHLYSHRAWELRQSLGQKWHLSREIIEVLREVLEGTIDFDQTFFGKSLREPNVNPDPEGLHFRNWEKKLRSLPGEERLKVQQVLQEKDDLFSRIYGALRVPDMENIETKDYVSIVPPHLIRDATWYLDNFFSSSLKYLGPLRVAPKTLYPLAPAADPNDVGLRGEHTASILELHKNKKIRYIPSANFENPAIDPKMITRTLEAAVIDWLQYLGVANSVESRDQGKLGHELKVGLSDSDSSHDLTHVGVGVSQVLPILVMCLLADSDSTLVFEQPELHLHPRVQTLLGDFFLSMALCNKQCIVESHSEYFVDRLRFRIASASPESKLHSQAKIYFVEKSSQASSFREVTINEYGAIPDWPEGFFDQSQQQAEDILRAAAMKRRARRGINDA